MEPYIWINLGESFNRELAIAHAVINHGKNG
jgi:hypothetical protein